MFRRAGFSLVLLLGDLFTLMSVSYTHLVEGRCQTHSTGRGELG